MWLGSDRALSSTRHAFHLVGEGVASGEADGARSAAARAVVHGGGGDFAQPPPSGTHPEKRYSLQASSTNRPLLMRMNPCLEEGGGSVLMPESTATAWVPNASCGPRSSGGLGGLQV